MGVGDGELLLFNGGGVSVWEDEQVLEMLVVMVAQQCECA